MLVVLYVLAILLAAFALSGVLPRYLAAGRRMARVEAFERHYRDWTEAHHQDLAASSRYGGVRESEESQRLRGWLVARRNQMQRDAEAVAKGVIYVAPPPAVGGGRYVPHSYFLDLFDQQSFTDHAPTFRLDELATTIHETEWQRERWKADLYNPWAWLRLSFERIVGFPRYALRLAGFGSKVTDSPGAKAGTAVFSVVVGLAGIGSFAVLLLKFLGG